MQVALNSYHFTRYCWAFEVGPCFFVFENPVVIFFGKKPIVIRAIEKGSRGCLG